MPAKKTTTAKKPTRRAAKGASAKAASPRRRTNASHDLVIVESPAKARTIAGILGPNYDVTASVGHVRDLPRSKLGVDVDNEFEPQYVVPKEKKEVVARIKEAASKANTIYLATDPDREGEAISWHLVEAAELAGRPMHRVVFHELTPDAIKEAFEHPRDIDSALVDAQQARRVLDRLVGYKISPLLWRKVRRGLSAGRVQSVAVRMVVDREREILGFNQKEYWTIDAQLSKTAQDEASFLARLRGKQGQRTFEIGNGDEALGVGRLLREARYVVKSVKRRDQHRRPAPPFTTSTLQQDASRRFGYTAKRTMALAQQLYEGIDLPGAGRVGLITYMRTDSMHLADVAVREIRAYAGRRFGGDFVPPSPRFYKARKGAQEAHEAIRPTSAMREPGAPELRGLSSDLRRLYTLIWQRAVACQMADAILDNVSVDVDATATNADVFHLRANASAVRFPGYRQLYEEARDTTSTDEEEQAQATPLPELSEGDVLFLRDLKPEQHFTEPPPRYTEATLVKALEENGIGRPSTYAPILSTIQDRGYVEREQRILKPTELGFVVNDFMVEQFPDIIDLHFTAGMEEELDEIASGARPWQPTVRELYNPLNEALEKAAEAPAVVQETGEHCPECERPLVRRFGRFGPFFACTGFPECRYTRPGEGEAQQAEASNETCDTCGSPMVVKRGRFGAFLACTKYPECKGTKPLLQKTGVLCPLDGGEIVERQTRKGRKFYGCANYPKCSFTSWQRPLPPPCPSCKGLIVTDKGRRAKCTNCDWKGAAPKVAGESP
ncbi:MAG TPA: type I DNA topoisomerase, partial [Dehalococcoidia bacterium]|nr:type I DNA topoisomerase [Dehalococcoidia bacterium]